VNGLALPRSGYKIPNGHHHTSSLSHLALHTRRAICSQPPHLIPSMQPGTDVVHAVLGFVAGQRCIPDAVEEPVLDPVKEIVLGGVGESILAQSQELSQSNSHLREGAGLQSPLPKQRSAPTHKQNETNLKTKTDGRTKKQSKKSPEIRKTHGLQNRKRRV